MVKYNTNLCDRTGNELMLQLTKSCPNSCSFCIDKLNKGVEYNGKPNFDKIKHIINTYHSYVTGITISGGEPLLYIDETLDLVKYIKEHTNLAVILNTSIPYQCVEKKEVFYEIIELCDSILLSCQHFDQNIADRIRRSKSNFDRNAFYRELPHKEKFVASINVFKPHLCTKEDIIDNIRVFNRLGFKNIKLAEVFERPDMHVSIKDVLGIKLKIPFAEGCSNKNVDITKYIPDFDGNLTIKTVCFIKSANLYPNFWDFLKIITRNLFKRKRYFFGVIQPNGEIYPYWF